MPLRLETEAEMKILSDIRGGKLLDKERELNRTDDVLDEVLQMLSLCFLSLGKKRESKYIRYRQSRVILITFFFRSCCVFPSSCH